MDRFLSGSLDDFPMEVESLCSCGMSPEFGKSIAAVCDEIRSLYDIEECVRQIDQCGIESFLYDLSAFLLELECPHEEITCGPLSSRFESPEKCLFLLKYLIAELRAARLFAQQRLDSGEMVRESGDKELTPFIASALNACKAQKLPGNVNANQILDLLRKSADQRLQKFEVKPTALFKTTLNEKKLAGIDEVCRILSKDFQNRLVLLLRRLEVTVSSFMWSDRVKPFETKIREILATRRAEIESMKTGCDVTHLLAASDRLLHIQRAGSLEQSHTIQELPRLMVRPAERISDQLHYYPVQIVPNRSQCSRKNTRSKAHPLATGEKPQDRGGRTNEMGALANESFHQQKAARENENRGRFHGDGHRRQQGGRGRGRGDGRPQADHHGGRGRFQGGQRSHEDQVRDEHSNRGGERNVDSHQGGRGGGRFHGSHGGPRGERGGPHGGQRS